MGFHGLWRFKIDNSGGGLPGWRRSEVYVILHSFLLMFVWPRLPSFQQGVPSVYEPDLLAGQRRDGQVPLEPRKHYDKADPGTEYNVPQSQLHSLHQLMRQEVEIGTRMFVGPDYRTSVGAGRAHETAGAGILSEVYSRRIEHPCFFRRVNALGLTSALKLVGYCLARPWPLFEPPDLFKLL